MNTAHKLTILQNSGHPKNTTIFVFLSLVFLHMIGAKYLEVSGFSFKSIQFTLKHFSFFLPISIMLVASVRRFKSYSNQFFLIYLSLVWVAALWILYLSHLDKVLLALIFFNILISFYFYQLWNEELKLACHNPNFTVFDLDDTVLHPIEGELIAGEKSFPVIFSNWDDSSCFLKLFSKEIMKGKVLLKIRYDNQMFVHHGIIVAEYGDFLGVGVKFGVESEDDIFNWAHFHEVIHERGIIPQWVK